MANLFVIDGNFNPMSFKDRLAPFLIAKEEYDKDKENYIKYRGQADAFKYLADTLPEDDPARSIYDNYMKDLNAYSNDFYARGMNPSNRNGLTQMRARYEGEIGRLVKATEIKNKDIEEQRTLYLKDPTYMFSHEAQDTPLSSYLNGERLKYKGYSGAMLAQQAATAAKSIAKAVSSISAGGNIDKYRKYWKETYGLDADTVTKAVSDPQSPEANVLAKRILDSVVDSSGIPSWGNDKTTGSAYKWAAQGLWDLAGETKYHDYEDPEAKAALDWEYKQKELALRAKYANEAAGTTTGAGVAINPSNLYSQREATNADHKVDMFKKYFYRDKQGQWKMNYAGWQEYNKKYTTPSSQVQGGAITGTTYMDSPFKSFIDSIGGAKYIKGKQFGHLGNLWAQYKKTYIDNMYDAAKDTQYIYDIDKEDSPDWKNKISRAAAGTNKLYGVDWNGKEWKSTGDDLSMSDFNDKDVHVTGTGMSEYGTVVYVKGKDGITKTYLLPSGINKTNEDNRDKELRNAAKWRQEIVSGKFISPATGKEQALSEQDKALRQYWYEGALQRAQMYQSQLAGVNKTKPQQFNVYSE